MRGKCNVQSKKRYDKVGMYEFYPNNGSEKPK